MHRNHIREREVLLEQLDLLAADLRPKREAARAVKRHASFAAEAVEMTAAAEKARAWFRDDYPRLAREIVAGPQLCRAAENGANELRHRFGVASNRDEGLAALPSPLVGIPEPPRTYVGGIYVPPSQALQLPAPPGDLKAAWWPQLLHGRPRPIGY